MALPLGAGGDGEVIDPHGGRADIEAGVLRVLGGPDVDASAYAADPLRPLRLARLAAELDLRPDEQTERLTRAAAPRVGEASPERVFAELRRTVAADGALEGIALADRLGLVAATLPELEALHGVEQSHFHHLDVFDHTLEVLARVIELERADAEPLGEAGAAVSELLEQPVADDLTGWEALRLGALVHDVGKPVTRAVRPDGRVTFLGHDAVGEEMVSKLCRRLRTSERLRTFLAGVTRHHLRLGFLVHERPLAPRTLYRYLAACQPVEVEVTVLSCADRLATRGAKAEPAIAAHLELAREVLPAALRWRAEGPPQPPIRGDELARALGIEPGPEVGSLLAALAEARYAGEVETPDEAVELARSLRQNPGP
jgi:poly(A) polymerase